MTGSFQRFTPRRACPICSGHNAMAHGQGRRCYGYLDATGDYARCTREDRAGGLEQNSDGTFSHFLKGNCRCGLEHATPSPAPDLPVQARRSHHAPTFRSFRTLCMYLRKTQGNGAVLQHWTYCHADGTESFRVVRVDAFGINDKLTKTYQPCHEGEDGRWQLHGPRGPLPLYRLPELLATAPDTPVIVVEGEKCVELTRSLGLNAVTTSAHGAHAPQLTDWSPMRGRNVALLPDAGKPGSDYTDKVSASLARLDPPALVRMVELPGLSSGEDIEQWIERRKDKGFASYHIREELQTLIRIAFAN